MKELPVSDLFDKVFTDKFDIVQQRLDLTEEQDKQQNNDPLLPVHGNTDFLKAVIIASNKANCLNDLTSLLNNSAKFQKALTASRLGHFQDIEFRPNLHSLVGFQNPDNINYFKSLSWLRPPTFFGGTKNIMIFDKIDANDILRGNLGNGYFLAACAAIAQIPERLERLFLSGKHYNPNGLHAVAICLNGIWQEILLDDVFPCTTVANDPAFINTSKRRQLWVMMLEKAWAKVHDGYLNISHGFIREALRDLTGASTKTFFTQENVHGMQKQWKILTEAQRNQYVLSAERYDQSGGKTGLAGSHAYNLIGVYEVARGKRIPINSEPNNRIYIYSDFPYTYLCNTFIIQ